MAKSAKSITTFRAEVDGKEYVFDCWSGSGCHRCEDQDGRRSLYTYCNRPWESFRYETVLRSAIRKQPKGVQSRLVSILIDKTKEAERKKADEQLKRFEGLYNGLSEENKERMKNYPTLHTEEDVNVCMGFMGLLTLLQD